MAAPHASGALRMRGASCALAPPTTALAALAATKAHHRPRALRRCQVSATLGAPPATPSSRCEPLRTGIVEAGGWGLRPHEWEPGLLGKLFCGLPSPRVQLAANRHEHSTHTPFHLQR
jgi:hypothetical protein